MAGELRLRTDSLEWRQVDGEIVALDLRSSQYLQINRTGAALWPHLVDGASRDNLVRTLVEQYDADEDTAGRDVDAFIEMLRQRQLLES